MENLAIGLLITVILALVLAVLIIVQSIRFLFFFSEENFFWTYFIFLILVGSGIGWIVLLALAILQTLLDFDR